MAEAGYPNGFKTLLRGVAQTDPKEIMVAIQGQLKQVGVDVEVAALPAAALSADRFKPLEENRGEMDYAGWSPSTGDADWAIRPLLYSTEWMPVGDNRSYYKNADADALIKQGMETSDQSKRKEIYKKAQEVLVEDGAWLMLHDMVQSVGVSNKLNNVAVWPIEIVLVKDANWSN